MFFNRVQLFAATTVLFVVLPILILAALFVLGSGSAVDNIAYIVFVANIMFFLFKTANWEFTNYYLRYFYILAFAIIAFRNLVFINSVIQNTFDYKAFADAILLLLSLILMYLNIRFVRASLKPKHCIDLSFPFRNGKYLITDGGDGEISRFINYHNKSGIHKSGNTNTSMRYATDIAKLDKFGFTVGSTLSKENASYKIYHEKVYAPCEAVVLKVVDGIDDNIPFSGNYPYSVGNHVVLKTENYYIVMGHLAKGSITVRANDRVTPAQQLALIGNCGLTPRPHLHMQVSQCEDGEYWKGSGVPIFFNKRYYPFKNKTIKVTSKDLGCA